MKIFRNRRAVVRVVAVLATVMLVVSACSSSDDGDNGVSDSVVPVTAPVSVVTTLTEDTATTVASTTTTASVVETVSIVVPFFGGNGDGTVAMSGDTSPVMLWFGSRPGEVSLDFSGSGVDVFDEVGVVEELVDFWFAQDDLSGDVEPSVVMSDDGVITDSFGTTYVVEAEGLPLAPGTETTTTIVSVTPTTTSTTTTTSVVLLPSTTTPSSSTTSSPPPTTSTSLPPTTTTSSTTTTTTSVVPVVLQVQVLNGSGVAGAAGRLTDRLAAENFVMLPAGNAPQRYSSSAVYYAEGWQDQAREVLAAANIDEIEDITPIPPVFAGDAAVVVLLGTDTAPAIRRESGGLRPRQRNDVVLPLSDDIPRDRYVPGLAYANLYTEVNENNPASTGQLADLAFLLKRAGDCSKYQIGGRVSGPDVWDCQMRVSNGVTLTLPLVYKDIGEILAELGFTPQNTCGAPQGYSFTDLLQPTREWDDVWKYYTGDAIFTTDRLIELHGGERINPESNLDFYIGEAVQTAYDILRSSELLSETETPQLILCEAWISPSGEIPEFANSMWYALLTPGIQPHEQLLSQGTYHVKEISRNGNFAYLIVCHPTIGERYVRLWWRDGGYRAEVTGTLQNNGCQATFEIETYREDTYGVEDIYVFDFGERVFSASDMQNFPRN